MTKNGYAIIGFVMLLNPWNEPDGYIVAGERDGQTVTFRVNRFENITDDSEWDRGEYFDAMTPEEQPAIRKAALDDLANYARQTNR